MISDFATPVTVTIIGVLLLRRIEGIKTEASRQSDFQTKWAEQFFDCCQTFLCTIERALALLTYISIQKNPNDVLGTELQSEISMQLFPKIIELELRIRRSVVFAPITGSDAKNSSHACFELIAKLANAKGGNADEIIEEMNRFNIAARRAHAEMLGLVSSPPKSNARPQCRKSGTGLL